MLCAVLFACPNACSVSSSSSALAAFHRVDLGVFGEVFQLGCPSVHNCQHGITGGWRGFPKTVCRIIQAYKS